METYVEGTPEQFKEFMNLPLEGPVKMLNMIKFKADGGEKGYAKYGEHAMPHLKKSGGKQIFEAAPCATVVGGETWDRIFVIEYPSRKAFLDMILSEEYQAGMHLRTDSVEDSRLICMQ